ncbi:hypothetical protein [Massilia brevitalea]|nr:hypothetical protein [Massilia brevitalea]
MSYDVVGPTSAQLLVLHQREQLKLASAVKGLSFKQMLEKRIDIL